MNAKPRWIIALGGVLLLVIGSLAVGTKTVRTWANQNTKDSLSVDVEQRTLLFSPGGKYLASIDGSSVILRKVEAGTASILGRANTSAVSGVVFDAQQTKLALAREDGQVEIWATDSLNLTHVLRGHRDRITALAFSSDGKSLVSGDSDANVLLWDVASGSLRLKLPEQRGAISAVAFSDDARMLGTAADDIVLWDPSSGERLFALPATNVVPVAGIMFVRGRRDLVSIDTESTITLWDLDNRAARAHFRGPDGAGTGVAFDLT